MKDADMDRATSDSDLGRSAYASWKDWTEDSFGSCSRGDARYFDWHLRRCHPGTIAHALEIGYGNGNFIGYLRQKGVAVTGIEMETEMRRRATAAGIENHADLSTLAAERQFDLIAAFDVFEHVPAFELVGLLTDLSLRLRPEGVLLCRVPNGESPFGRIFQHGDLTHVTTLGLSKFRQLAASCRLEVTWHGEMPWYRTARNPKRLLRAAVRRAIERTIAFAYLWNADNLSPNIVVTFRRR